MWGIFVKKCFKCEDRKPLSEFYKHSQMADGHLNKCKECAKRDSKKNRDANLEYYKGYDAWRYKNDPRVKERHDAYKETPEGKVAIQNGTNAWRDRNPEARAAHSILNRSVRNGRITKPDMCSCCGKFTPSRLLHGHHHDYAFPLDVTWLCASCHAAVHNMD